MCVVGVDQSPQKHVLLSYQWVQGPAAPAALCEPCTQTQEMLENTLTVVIIQANTISMIMV